MDVFRVAFFGTLGIVAAVFVMLAVLELFSKVVLGLTGRTRRPRNVEDVLAKRADAVKPSRN